MRAILILALVLGGCTATWERRAVLVAGNAATLCDLSQTLWMANRGRWDKGVDEADPIMGTHPSTGAILAANLGTIAINTAAYFLLPKRWGNALNTGVLVVEGANVTTQPGTMLGSSIGFQGPHRGCDVGR